MEPERWSRITDLFQEASELPEHARTELLARVSPDDRAEVESLLAHAADDTMDIVHDAVAAAARQLLPESARPAPPLSGGARLGRYVVLDWIGAGGMGVVYAAWDPQLDRKVAIKLLHGHEGDEDGLTSPLIGEARAMARLAHPNVLAIHDVGTLDGQVFVATEFVDGVTLRRWLQTPRTWREIRGVLLAAGQGLAAAHAAGIVHRDFKPDNIMIGGDGRVRVMDFGLARAGRTERGTSAATATTILAGTPAYMAPEQWDGGPIDQRTDVFSFCVAAWESFHGERPFASDARAVRTLAIGRPSDLRSRSRLPRRMSQILLRGLRSAPDERYPDMGSLLAELERDPWARLMQGARLAVTLAALVAVAGAVFFVLRPGIVSVRVTSYGVALTPSLVQVGPHALDIGVADARGEVPAGTYRLTARAPDHVPRETIVEVERGHEVHLDLDLQHEQGHLDLDVDPPGSTIYVDETDRGGRLRGLRVDTGEHRVRVRHSGHYDVERIWDVAVGQTRSGYVALPPGEVWSRRDNGVQRVDVVLGDVDGDGRADLLHRSFSTLTVLSPWDDRTLWRAPTDSMRLLEHWAGDVDGDALLDVVVLEYGDARSAQLTAWSGARLADLHARPLWSRAGHAVADPSNTESTTALIDIDGDGAVDLVTAQLELDGVTACTGRSGSVIWRAPLGDSVRGFVVDDAAARLYVATDTSRRAFALRTGAPLWSRPVAGGEANRIIAFRGTEEGGLLVASHDTEARRFVIEACDARDGAPRWTRSDEWETGAIPEFHVGEARDAGRVLIKSADIIGLDAHTGAEQWRIAESGRMWVVDRGPDATLAIATATGVALHRVDDGAHQVDIELGVPAVAMPTPFDWDADGEVELAVAGQDGTIAMVTRDGDREGSLYLPDSAPMELVPLGDIDRDGFDDLLVQGAGGPSLVLGPKVLWSRLGQDAVRAAPLVADLDADGRPEIVVVGIFGGARGLHCFDAATGEACWPAEHIAGADIIRAPALVPRADGGFDLLSRGGWDIFLHDGRTGARRSYMRTTNVGYASPALADLDGDGALEALIAPWDANSLLAVDPASLATRWRLPLPSGTWNPPVVARDGDTTRLVLHLLDGELRVTDASSRTPRWTRPLGQLPYTAPTIADLDGDGALELITSEVGEPGDLVCLRLSDGAELWRRPGLAGRSSPTVPLDLDGDGTLELLHTSNGSGALALDRHGVTRWQFKPYPSRAQQPASDGGGLVTDLDGDGAAEYITALRDGVVYVLDARMGGFRWQFRGAVGRIEAPPTAADVDGDGLKELVIAGHDRILRVLRTPARLCGTLPQ